MKKIVISCITLLLAGTLLTACNTVSGLGKDVEAGGKKLSKLGDRK